jgi:hypothetical protein
MKLLFKIISSNIGDEMIKRNSFHTRKMIVMKNNFMSHYFEYMIIKY